MSVGNILELLKQPLPPFFYQSLEQSKNAMSDLQNSPAYQNDPIKDIATTRTQLYDVKKSLGGIVDSIVDNPSLFSQAANAWGDWSVWQKVGLGIAVSCPPIALGLAANMMTLLTIGSVSAAVYGTTGVVLEDHFVCSEHTKERIKLGILNIADVLDVTIQALDSICQRLEQQLKRFSDENTKLAQHVTRLEKEVSVLIDKIESLASLERSLCATKDKLQATIDQLQGSVEVQSDLLRRTQNELRRVTQEYQNAHEALVREVNTLNRTRERMDKGIDDVSQISDTLKNTIASMSETMAKEQERQDVFQERLESFLADKEVGLERVTGGFETTERQFSQVALQLESNHDLFNQVLRRQEEQLQRMERLEQQFASGLHVQANTPKISDVPQAWFPSPSDVATRRSCQMEVAAESSLGSLAKR